MPYIHGTVENKRVVDKIVDLLTAAPIGSVDPYWKKVNSGVFQNDGYILKSKGKSGQDNIFIRFSYTTATNYICVSTLEHYEPNSVSGLPGVITNESSMAYLAYNSGSYKEESPVEYHLSFDRNKVMLALSNNKVANQNRCTGFLWVGMPERLDSNDKTNGAVFIACSTMAQLITAGANNYSNHGIGRMVKNREHKTNCSTNMITLGSITGATASIGWENTILPNIYLEDRANVEGVRALLDGVHPIYQDATNPSFKDRDEIVKNAKRFTVMGIAYDSVKNNGLYPNSFPSTWIAFEQL